MKWLTYVLIPLCLLLPACNTIHNRERGQEGSQFKMKLTQSSWCALPGNGKDRFVPTVFGTSGEMTYPEPARLLPMDAHVKALFEERAAFLNTDTKVLLRQNGALAQNRKLIVGAGWDNDTLKLMILIIPNEGFPENTLDAKKMIPMVFANGATHRIIGTVTMGGHQFDSEKGDPLEFVVDHDRGYIYASGTGNVTLPDGSRVILPAESEREITFGAPIKP